MINYKRDTFYVYFGFAFCVLAKEKKLILHSCAEACKVNSDKYNQFRVIFTLYVDIFIQLCFAIKRYLSDINAVKSLQIYICGRICHTVYTAGKSFPALASLTKSQSTGSPTGGKFQTFPQKHASSRKHTHTHTDNPSKLHVSVSDGVCSWESWTCEENAIVNQIVLIQRGIVHDNDNNRSENVRCVGKPLQKQVRVRGWWCMTPRWLYSSQGGGKITRSNIHTQV
jgi:hypothetical protein